MPGRIQDFAPSLLALALVPRPHGVRLIDASQWQGVVDWHKAATVGHVAGAWVKATEGKTLVDPRFATNVREARLNMRVGVYHFAHPEQNSPVVEALHFTRTVQKIGRRDLRPMLDYEMPTKLSPAQTLAWIRSFNRTVHVQLGVLPMFYSYASLIEHLGLKVPVGAGLWLADYGPNNGLEHPVTIPRPWKKAVAVQFTSKGHVPGIAGDVDLTDAASLWPALAYPLKGRL
jgi:lysozyme